MHHISVESPKSFSVVFMTLRDKLMVADPVDVGEWQSQHKSVVMRELLHVAFDMPLPTTQVQAAEYTGARMPWAEDHFLERVGGEPLNPSPSEAWWPFREKKDGDTNTSHKSEGQAFSHTYPERMWPKWANVPQELEPATGYPPNRGLRFGLGDLRDVVMQLYSHPLTRQAYLPIWFPEDTGAVHGKRVPCTLGYHFIIRDGKLDISYFMRSTDLVRHFQDDVYLAIRLAQWVVEEVNKEFEYKYNEPQQYPLEVGRLIFHTANLHIFDQDVDILKYWKDNGKLWY